MDFHLETYVDADYARKAEDRRSVSGVAICCGGTPVSWLSRTQKGANISTTEAEYVAMADGVTQGVICEGGTGVSGAQSGAEKHWRVQRQQGGNGLGEKNLEFSNSKHIDVRHHFLREMAARGDTPVQYIQSDDQPADVLTKALDRKSFEGPAISFGARVRFLILLWSSSRSHFFRLGGSFSFWQYLTWHYLRLLIPRGRVSPIGYINEYTSGSCTVALGTLRNSGAHDVLWKIPWEEILWGDPNLRILGSGSERY